MKYAILREKLELLNDDLSHYKSTNDVCTPMPCVEEMVDKIPTEFWERDSISILDPCCGNGNFPAYLKEKIKKDYSLICNDLNEDRLKNATDLLDGVEITNDDFFTIKKTYDLIIANPPFAKIMSDGKRAAKNHSLSREFVAHALDLVNEGGYLVFILPDNWMSMADRNNLPFRFSQFQFIHIDIHTAKKYFPKIGSSFTWFVLKKVKNENSFIIKNGYKIKNETTATIPVGIKSLPLYYDEQVVSILDKTIHRDGKRFKVLTSSFLHKYTKRDLLRDTKDKQHTYKIWHTQNKTVWSTIPHKFQKGWKVFISLTSYYQTFIEKDCGTTQSIAFVSAENEEAAKRIKESLDHPLFKFINDIHRFGNFNNIRILQSLPMPETADIYKEFGIDEKEQDLIELFSSVS